MRSRAALLTVALSAGVVTTALAVSDGQYTTEDQGCTDHGFAQGPTSADHGQDAPNDHCQPYRLSAGTDNNPKVVRVGLDHEEPGPDPGGFNRGHAPHHGTTFVGAPGSEILIVHYGTGVTKLPGENPITGHNEDGPYSDDHTQPELEVRQLEADNASAVDDAPPRELHVYQGGDDNLESGEHDGIPDSGPTIDPKTNEPTDNRDLQDGPSDGSGYRLDVTPNADEPQKNVDPENAERDPLPAAYAGAGVCTDGVCLTAGTRERQLYDGGADEKTYADQAEADDYKDVNDECKQTNEGNCVRTIHDAQGDWYSHPGVTFYEDPDPQASGIGVPGPGNATHVGTGGVRIGGTRVLEPPAESLSAENSAPIGCSWPLKFDTDTLNAAFPDRHATYWLTRFAAVPGSRLVIRGRYPLARYFSFHAYDEAQHPVGSLADFEIAPDAGSDNPFQTPGTAPGGSYTAFVEFTARPADAAPNTVYGGGTDYGTPNPGGFLIYRVYVPTDPDDPAGGEPLPDVTLETANGAISIPFGQCPPLPPSTGGALNDAIQTSSFPDEVPRAVPFPPAQSPPQFVRFYSTEGAVLDRFPSNPVSSALPQSKGGYLSNQHIAYLYLITSRQYGDLLVVRARSPRAPDTGAGEEPTDPNQQVRYWSICQNEFATQRFTECTADYETVLDAQGFFTFVISDPADRPANATATNAVNWLPWGGAYYDGNVIYRHMLPATGFAGAIQNVPHGTSPASVMGDYYPVAAYCTKTTFEQGGVEACLAGAQ